MGKFLKKFSAITEYETYMANKPNLPNVSIISNGQGVKKSVK